METFTKPDNNIAQLELQGTEHVAIFGSGAGGHSFAAVRGMKGNGRVVAVDVRKELLDRVQSDAQKMRISGLTTKVGDYQRVGGTGLMGASQDAVVVPNTLFAASDKEACLKEADRVLKPQGKMLIVDWKESFGGMGPQPEHIVTVEAAKALAEKVGFTLVKEFTAGAQHYGLVYMKQAPTQTR